MNTYEIIKRLAKEKNISIRQLEINFGYSNGYIGSWKKQTPNSIELARLADFFNVSVDYLLGRTDDPSFEKKTNPTEEVTSLFRIDTSHVDPDIREEVEEEIKNFSEFLIQKAMEKKARRESNNNNNK